MSQKIDSLLIGAYVLMCVLLGGSVQGVWGNLALQLLGLALLTRAALARDTHIDSPRFLPFLLMTGLLIVLLQVIPLPPSVWTALPGRSILKSGFAELGMPLPPLPISEVPSLSVTTLFAAIPAIAIFASTMKLRPDARWIGVAILVSALLSIFFGALQAAGGPNSWARLYRVSSPGATGFFANQNHMATLMLVTIPTTVILLSAKKSDRRGAVAGYATAAVLLGLLVFGLVLNTSFAGYALALPVLVASLAATRAAGTWRRLALPVAGLAILGAIVFVATQPIADGRVKADASTSVASRSEVWEKTARAISASFPVGTGLGSFETTYRQFEDPNRVTSEYVNHAHNDYLEFVLEMGAPGLVMLVAFLAWWLVTTSAVWSSARSTSFARGATVVSGTILAHSVVDFPLRTAAISGIFAASLAIMARSLGTVPNVREGETRPTRHVHLG